MTFGSGVGGVAFTVEQEKYIIDLREGNGPRLNWQQMSDAFNHRFPTTPRSKGALQVHYSRSLQPTKRKKSRRDRRPSNATLKSSMDEAGDDEGSGNESGDQLKGSGAVPATSEQPQAANALSSFPKPQGRMSGTHNISSTIKKENLSIGDEFNEHTQDIINTGRKRRRLIKSYAELVMDNDENDHDLSSRPAETTRSHKALPSDPSQSPIKVSTAPADPESFLAIPKTCRTPKVSHDQSDTDDEDHDWYAEQLNMRHGRSEQATTSSNQAHAHAPSPPPHSQIESLHATLQRPSGAVFTRTSAEHDSPPITRSAPKRLVTASTNAPKIHSAAGYVGMLSPAKTSEPYSDGLSDAPSSEEGFDSSRDSVIVRKALSSSRRSSSRNSADNTLPSSVSQSSPADDIGSMTAANAYELRTAKSSMSKNSTEHVSRASHGSQSGPSPAEATLPTPESTSGRLSRASRSSHTIGSVQKVAGSDKIIEDLDAHMLGPSSSTTTKPILKLNITYSGPNSKKDNMVSAHDPLSVGPNKKRTIDEADPDVTVPQAKKQKAERMPLEWTIVDPTSIADDLTIPAAFRNPPEGRVLESANRQIRGNPPSMRLRRVGEKIAVVAAAAVPVAMPVQNKAKSVGHKQQKDRRDSAIKIDEVRRKTDSLSGASSLFGLYDPISCVSRSSRTIKTPSKLIEMIS